MVKYVCMHCEYTWDSETGDETYKVPAGPIEDFPDDWVCPQCAAGIEGIILLKVWSKLFLFYFLTIFSYYYIISLL